MDLQVKDGSCLLGYDTDEWITSYIRDNYGRDSKYREIADVFREKINSVFSSPFRIRSLYVYERTYLFEFTFHGESSEMCIKSFGEYGKVKVFIRFKSLKHDPVDGY